MTLPDKSDVGQNNNFNIKELRILPISRELTSFFQVRNLRKVMIWSIFILLRNIGKMLN